MRNSRFYRLCLPGLAVIILMAAAPHSPAMEALRPSLKEMGQKIVRLLKGRSEDSIAVGAFTGTGRIVSSSGPGIKKVLVEELEAAGVRVKKTAALDLKGDYLHVLDKESNLLSLHLEATVRDSAGTKVLVLEETIDDPEVLAQVLGLNKPDLGDGLTPKRLSEEVKKHIDDPTADVAGTKVRTNPKSPYAVEVLVEVDGKLQPRKPTIADDGLPYVQIDKGEKFVVNLINDSPHDAAVELVLDGLSVFAFSEKKGYRHFIIPRNRNLVVKGWHRNNEVSDKFLITEYAKGAAAELLVSPDHIGTITVTFRAAWEPKEKPPADEGGKFRDPFNPAIGRGEPVKTPYKEVVREHGRIRDVISIRYKKP